MKKDVIFTSVLLIIGALLFLLRATGMMAHVAISALGVVILIVYAVLTKKEWKIPALEVIMRGFYGIALITGAVMMKVHGVAILAIVHKASAALFVVFLAGLLAHKLATSKKA